MCAYQNPLTNINTPTDMGIRAYQLLAARRYSDLTDLVTLAEQSAPHLLRGLTDDHVSTALVALAPQRDFRGFSRLLTVVAGIPAVPVQNGIIYGLEQAAYNSLEPNAPRHGVTIILGDHLTTMQPAFRQAFQNGLRRNLDRLARMPAEHERMRDHIVNTTANRYLRQVVNASDVSNYLNQRQRAGAGYAEDALRVIAAISGNGALLSGVRSAHVQALGDYVSTQKPEDMAKYYNVLRHDPRLLKGFQAGIAGAKQTLLRSDEILKYAKLEICLRTADPALARQTLVPEARNITIALATITTKVAGKEDIALALVDGGRRNGITVYYPGRSMTEPATALPSDLLRLYLHDCSTQGTQGNLERVLCAAVVEAVDKRAQSASRMDRLFGVQRGVRMLHALKAAATTYGYRKDFKSWLPPGTTKSKYTFRGRATRAILRKIFP